MTALDGCFNTAKKAGWQRLMDVLALLVLVLSGHVSSPFGILRSMRNGRSDDKTERGWDQVRRSARLLIERRVPAMCFQKFGEKIQNISGTVATAKHSISINLYMCLLLVWWFIIVGRAWASSTLTYTNLSLRITGIVTHAQVDIYKPTARTATVSVATYTWTKLYTIVRHELNFWCL